MNWWIYVAGIACGVAITLVVCAAWFIYAFKDVWR